MICTLSRTFLIFDSFFSSTIKALKLNRIKEMNPFKSFSEEGKATTAGFAGSASGVGGSVALVSVMERVAGLTAPGITSGLAALGALVSGGMATGIAIVAAVPVVAGGATYDGYKLYSSYSKI